MDSRILDLAALIDNLIASQHECSSALWKARDDGANTAGLRALRWQAAKICADKTAAQEELAAMFARRHGWRQSDRRFSVGCLAVEGKHGHGRDGWPWRLLDHADFFRKAGRAAAAVGHLYDVPRDARSWASEHGLKVTLSRFPSWYWPLRCRLVIFTAADPARAALLRKPPPRTPKLSWPKFVSTAMH